MTEINYTVPGSVKKPYIKPDFEVINLDNQAPLLVQSAFGAGFQSIDDENL